MKLCFNTLQDKKRAVALSNQRTAPFKKAESIIVDYTALLLIFPLLLIESELPF